MLCQKWPLRWNQYVLYACWKWVTPDPALLSNATTFCVSFGRDSRTKIDKMTLSLDGSEFRGEPDSFVADKHQAVVELKVILEKRRTNEDKVEMHRMHILGAAHQEGTPRWGTW